MLIYFDSEGINIYFLFPFLCFFCAVGASFISSFSCFAKFPSLQNLVVSFGEMLAIIPYLLSLKIDRDTFQGNSKRNSINSSPSQTSKSLLDKYQLEYNDYEEELSHVEFYHIILLGFLDFLQSFCTYFGNELFDNKYQLYLWSTYILFLCIFNKLLLHTRLYRHHIVSFIIFFILDILHTIIIILDKDIDYKKLQLIFLFISNLCFSFEIVFVKRLIEKSFISIFKLCFFLGLSTTFFNLTTSIITTFISYTKYNNNNKKPKVLFSYKDYFNDMENYSIFIEILLILVFMILNGLYNIFQFVAIKYLSPNHVLITQLILALYYSIILQFSPNNINTITLIFSIIFHIICFITQLIFLEIIQLNFCVFNKDTKLHIGIRSDIDKINQNKEELYKTKSEEIEDNDDENNRNKSTDRTNSEVSYNENN